MTSNLAFLLTFLGILGISCEFIWPGGVLPGVAGSLSMCWGVAALARLPLTRSGILWLAFAAGLFLIEILIEASWRTNVLAGMAGTAALSVGSSLLVTDRCPAGAIPASLFLGCLICFLCHKAKQARCSKWLDLTAGDPMSHETGNFPLRSP